MWIDIDQNTDNWLDKRAGKVTGSAISKIMASPREYLVVLVSKDTYAIANITTKRIFAKRYSNKIDADKALSEMVKKDLSKSFGEPAKQLAVDIAIEQITGNRIENNYTNEHMERGHEQEPIARALYESEYFCKVDNGGFYDNGDTGCSPDGLIMSDGLAEIKSVIPSAQYKTLTRGTYDPAYKWQLNFNLKESGRDWIDYISYCANFPDNRKLIVYHMFAKEQSAEFKMIDDRLSEFKALIIQTKHNIEG